MVILVQESLILSSCSCLCTYETDSQCFAGEQTIFIPFQSSYFWMSKRGKKIRLGSQIYIMHFGYVESLWLLLVFVLLPFPISGDIKFCKLRECLVNEKLINLIISIQFELDCLFSFLLHCCVFPILDELKVR